VPDDEEQQCFAGVVDVLLVLGGEEVAPVEALGQMEHRRALDDGVVQVEEGRGPGVLADGAVVDGRLDDADLAHVARRR
jgi:hypothetical protein